ncbi:MAG: sigma 54-interacting transcriptional regulator [Gemmatimonadota bacterium]|nr:sigma 54-interacting transcriptional regulator [Gemmatimonadota bacterium]
MKMEPASTSYWEIGGHPDFLVSVDERVVDVRERLERLADTSVTIILVGEKGVGKEVLAHRIHNLSRRRDRPMISFNAYAIPRSALARELFDRHPSGKLWRVEDGTLYLHGIELLPDHLRLRLLEWYEEHPSGEDGPGPRFVLSSEQPSLPENELEAFETAWNDRTGGAVRIDIPPLRDRVDDIPLLAHHILNKYASFYGSRIETLRSSFVTLLQSYAWPGNVRELERVIRRYLVVEDEETVRRELRNKQPQVEGTPIGDFLLEPGTPLKTMVDRASAVLETRAIERALHRAKWNKKEAAAELDVSYKTLLNKIKEYGIEG